MVASRRRRWSSWAALVPLAILSLAPAAVLAAERPAGTQGVQCRTIVRDFLRRAAVMRRSDEQIVGLLDAKRYRQAQSALRSAVSRYPDAWAGYTLGTLYAAGLGVRRSADAAFHWYLWSAKRGSGPAQRQVANAYLDGEGTERNVAKAAYWFRIGIAPSQLARMYRLSEVYAKGDLTPVDRAKARHYLQMDLTELRKLAKEPNAEAAYDLGLAYERGQGVSQDRKQAMRYLCRAAALQYAPAVTAILHPRGPSE